jgi:hypothetical protein
LFRGFDQSRFPATTLPALALAAAAYSQSDSAGEAVSFALREALFERGVDISSADVLVSMAIMFNIPAPADDALDTVVADWHEGQARGVKGSPHFFCDGHGDVFCPSLEISRDADGRAQIHRNSAKLDAFLATCLACADSKSPTSTV